MIHQLKRHLITLRFEYPTYAYDVNSDVNGKKMVLVCYNVFGLFVRHPSWSVEGETKVSKHPVGLDIWWAKTKLSTLVVSENTRYVINARCLSMVVKINLLDFQPLLLF